jgi:hypothetical protein
MVHIVLFPALVVPFLDESLTLRMGRCGPDFKRQGGHLRGAGATCRGLVKIRREFFEFVATGCRTGLSNSGESV